jgi:nicotinamidase-related amidase
MLNSDDVILIVVDIQEKLIRAMFEKEKMLENVVKLIKGILLFDIPILLTEQYPRGLGQTVSEIASLIPDYKPIPKLSFSCCGNQQFMQALGQSGKTQILLIGIETHVCVYQTAIDLINLGYQVNVVTDCVSSRTKENIHLALHRMEIEGAKLTGTEMTLFELLKIAEGDKFKDISNFVK